MKVTPESIMSTTPARSDDKSSRGKYLAKLWQTTASSPSLTQSHSAQTRSPSENYDRVAHHRSLGMCNNDTYDLDKGSYTKRGDIASFAPPILQMDLVTQSPSTSTPFRSSIPKWTHDPPCLPDTGISTDSLFIYDSNSRAPKSPVQGALPGHPSKSTKSLSTRVRSSLSIPAGPRSQPQTPRSQSISHKRRYLPSTLRAPKATPMLSYRPPVRSPSETKESGDSSQQTDCESETTVIRQDPALGQIDERKGVVYTEIL